MKNWLDKYEYGGEAGYTDIPFKYNSAWGGQFQDGGKLNTPEAWEKSIRSVESEIGDPHNWTMESYNKLQNKLNEYKNWRENTKEGKAVIDYHNEPNEYIVPLPMHLRDKNTLKFLEPTDPKLPSSYVIPYRTPSSELATSIGGEDEEPAFLVPSFKYGHPLEDPYKEFLRTGEHLGGPFKTWQEADEWDRNIRHPYVEKGQSIPTPLKRWGKDFAMGGSLPGSVGFTYARTQGIPSEGPYAKKTMPSAQNGKDLPYHPITNPEGYHLQNTLEKIKKLPSKEKRYEPTNAVKNLKSTLSVASLVGSSNPFTEYLAQVAGGTGDLYTSARYAIDQNWPKAKEDFVQGALGFIPYAKAIPGMKIGTDYFTKGAKLFNKWLKRVHGASDIKTLTESPTSSYPVQENGGMTYYQHGLDWKPKTISRDGSKVPKNQNAKYIIPNESTSLGTPRRDAELLAEIDKRKAFEKYIGNQAQIKQGKKSTPQQEAERKRKNKAYASSLPNAKYNEQTGDVERINPNRSVTGEAENFMSRREDKAGEHALGALDAAGYAIGAGELAGAGYNAAKAALAKSMESGLLSKFKPAVKKELLELSPSEKFSFKYTPPKETLFVPSTFDKEVKKEAFKYLDLTKDPRYLERVRALDAEARAAGYESNLEHKLKLFHKQGSMENSNVYRQTQSDYFPFNIETKQKIPYTNEYGVNKDALGRATTSSTGFKKWVMDGPESIQGLNFTPEYGAIEINAPRHIKGNVPARGTVHHELKHHWTNKLSDEPYYSNLLSSSIVPKETNTFLPRDFFEYYSKPTEIDAHVMTNMRDEMVQKGILKDHFDELTKDKLVTFIKENPSYRGLTEYFKPGKEIAWDKNKFISVFNKALPAMIPPVIVVGETTQQKKQGGVIKDNRGQWAHPGEITEIGSNNITMKDVPYPVLGIGKDGQQIMMQPEQEYTFNQAPVTEIPMAQEGRLMTAKDWQDVNSNDYGAEEAKLRVDQSKFDIYRLPGNKFKVVPKKEKVKELPPIYTDDPRKVQAYKDSLDVFNSSKFLKEHPLVGNYFPGKEDTRQLNINTNEKNIKKYSPKLATTNTGYYWDYKKPVQPVIYQEEPTLKKQVLNVEPIHTSLNFNPQLKTIEHPNIELSPIEQGNYMVGYIDENNQGVDRGFITPEQRDAFVKELEQRNLSSVQPYRGNITEYDRRATQTKKVNQKSTGGWLSQYK